MKYVVGAAVIIGALGAVVWFLPSDPPSRETVAERVSVSKPAQESGEQSVDLEPLAGRESDISHSNQPAGVVNTAQYGMTTEHYQALDDFFSANPTAEQIEWQTRHGHYRSFTSSQTVTLVQKDHPYDAFDEPTLEQLSAGGDLVAAAMLGDRLLTTSESELINRGIEQHKHSAALGSTYSAMRVGEELLRIQTRTNENGQQPDGLEEAYAWYAVAAENGDPTANLMLFGAVQNGSIGDGSRSPVCQKKDEILRDIQNSRQANGLDPLLPEPMPGSIELMQVAPPKFSNFCT